MSDRLFLQNSLSYFSKDKSADFGCIICKDDINFYKLSEKCLIWDDTLNIISNALMENSRIVALIGDEGYGKSKLLRYFAMSNKSKYDAIVFVEFDKRNYIKAPSLKAITDDNYVLKKCFSSIFNSNIYNSKRDCNNPFTRSTTEEAFVQLANQNTLLIIDSLDTEEYVNYISELAEMGFSVLYASRKIAENTPSCVITVKCTRPDDKSSVQMLCGDNFEVSQKDDYIKLCNLLENRPSAIYLAKRFIKTLSRSASQLTNKLNEVAREKQLSVSKDYMKLFYFIAELSNSEKEVLRTIGVLQSNFIETKNEYNNKETILNFKVCEDILSKKSSKWIKLFKLGFLKQDKFDRIYAENYVYTFIINFLKPTAPNCACFMNFIKQEYAVELSQMVKDFDALFCSIHDIVYTPTRYSENLLDCYSYFLSTDIQWNINIYHMCFAYILNHMGTFANHKYTAHLSWKNRTYFAVMFSKAVGSSSVKELYKNCDSKAFYGTSYSPEIRGELDVLRVCTELIRNSGNEHHTENLLIYRHITHSIDKIYEILIKSNFSYKDKHSIASDVMRLCAETFFYFSDISYDGNYYPHRCHENNYNGNFCNNDLDSVYATTIFPLKSAETLRMFASLHRMAVYFLELATIVKLPEHYEYYKESFRRRKMFTYELSILITRLEMGFDKFCDFYSSKNARKNVHKELSDSTDKKLNSIIRKANSLHSNFYDRNGIKTSVNYANQVVTTLKTSVSPFRCIKMFSDVNYPVSYRCKMALSNQNFGKMIVNSENIGLLSKKSLYVLCASQLHNSRCCLEYNKNILNNMKDAGIIKGDVPVKDTPKICHAFIKIISDSVAYRVKNSETNNIQKDLSTVFQTSPGIQLILNHTQISSLNKFPEGCVFLALYGIYINKTLKIPRKTINDALFTLLYKRIIPDVEFSREGFAVIAKSICSKQVSLQAVRDLFQHSHLQFDNKEKYEGINNYLKKEGF